MKKKLKKQTHWKKANPNDMDHLHGSKHRPEKIKYKHTRFWIEQEGLDEEPDLFKKGNEGYHND